MYSRFSERLFQKLSWRDQDAVVKSTDSLPEDLGFGSVPTQGSHPVLGPPALSSGLLRRCTIMDTDIHVDRIPIHIK